MARQQQHAQTVWAVHLAAMDGDVLLAGFRIARDQEAGADVGPAVVLVVGRHRKLLQEIDVAVDDLLHRRVADLAPRQRIGCRVLESGEQLCGSTPIASAIQPRFDVRPETTGIGCPPGLGNSVARSPSSRLA